MIMALAGITIERNTRVSSTKLSPQTSAITGYWAAAQVDEVDLLSSSAGYQHLRRHTEERLRDIF